MVFYAFSNHAYIIILQTSVHLKACIVVYTVSEQLETHLEVSDTQEIIGMYLQHRAYMLATKVFQKFMKRHSKSVMSVRIGVYLIKLFQII